MAELPGGQGARGPGRQGARAPERVAIITAGSGGIGGACARRLAADGWKLALMSAGAGAERVAAELGAASVRGDVRRGEDLDRLIDAALEAHGRIDGAVFNSGHAPRGDILALTDADWESGHALLLRPAFHLARRLTPLMRRQGNGSVVAISSLAALEPAKEFPVSSVYRAALGAWVRLWAREVAADGIRVNAVLPGLADNWPVDDTVRAALPRGRTVTVEEVAAAVAWLLSDAASGVTGQQLPVDGGERRGL